MPSQRADIVLGPEEVDALLRRARMATLVTLGPDGYPEPVAMWCVVDEEGSVWMRTYAASQKAVNLRRDPRAALLVEEGERYAELRGVRLTGTVELVDDVDRICEVMGGLLVKYEGLDPEHLPAAMEAYRERARKQVALRFVVERMASWDHAKLGSRA